MAIISRGGVEDTRFEANAKAKGTKKSDAKAKDSPFEDKPSPGQGQECSRPRPLTKDTGASVLQKKRSEKKFSGDLKKKVLKIFFRAISKKKFFKIIFFKIIFKIILLQTFYNSKNSAVLESRTGQFLRTWSFETKDLTFEAKTKDFKMCPWGRPRGQGRPRELQLWLLAYCITKVFISNTIIVWGQFRMIIASSSQQIDKTLTTSHLGSVK